jgi:PKD repeat protein
LPLDPAIDTPNKWDNLGIATLYPRGTRQGVYGDLYVLDDINDQGYAVGNRRRYGLAGSSSVLTTPAFDAVTYLPTPYGGYAKAINNQNMIVGATGSNSTTDLNALIPSGSGWILTAATAINDNGDIAGTGLLDGQVHGFLLISGQVSPPPVDNQLPVAMVDAGPTVGRAPLTVNFSSAGSYDPDGTTLTFAWDFGDGSVTESENASYTYTVPGTYIAVLTVTDDLGMTATAQVEIKVRKSGGRRK